MKGGESAWFSARQLDHIHDPESVASKHRSTVRRQIEEKVNGGLIEDLERIPELIEYMDSTTMEAARLQSEPAQVGRGLGELYQGGRTELVFGLLLSEKKPDETTEEFVERFDTIWEDIREDVQGRIQNAQLSTEVRRLFRAFTRELLEKVNDHVSLAEALWDVKVRIPVEDFVKWTVDQKGESEYDYLPELLDTAFAISVDQSLPRRFADYWDLLTQAAQDNGIQPPDGSGWTIDPKSPSAGDLEKHEAALAGLDDELQRAAHQFWDETQVLERDQLMALGLYSVARLQPRDRDILNRVPCSNRDDGWNRYDTRRANVLTDDRELPLLVRETVTRSGTDEKLYEFTAYGRFVHWLASYVEEKRSYSAVLRDCLSDIPGDLMDEANAWVTEYTGADRRLEQDLSESSGSAEDVEVLNNFILWTRVVEASDDSDWAED